MSGKLSTIFFLIFGVAVLFPMQSALAQKASSRPEVMTHEVIHTVQQNESLWQIAKYFGIDPFLLAQLNNLDNPDMIFPGNKLTIEVQSDFSLRVVDQAAGKKPGLDSQILLQVTHPSRDDIFAPENPLVEMTETISGPRRAASPNALVFKTFFEFVEWLVGDESDFKPTKAASSPSFDPSPGAPYTISSRIDILHILSGGTGAYSPDDLYKPPARGSLSPPPKAL